MKRLHRQSGPLDLELIPELGGAIGKLTWHGREILRSLPDGQNVTVNQGGLLSPGTLLQPYRSWTVSLRRM